MRKHTISTVFVSVFLILSLLLCSIPIAGLAESFELTDEQRNAVAMLNYITVLTQSINDSKNSRLYLEEVYSSLINDTYPNAVSLETLEQITGILNTINDYRMIEIQRDRLKYIYEQEQAEAIRSAVPSPEKLLDVATDIVKNQKSPDPYTIASKLVGICAESVSNYMSGMDMADQNYLQGGWELDDEEMAALHESRKGTFRYIIETASQYGIPGEAILNENAAEKFSAWKSNENITSRIHFLESEQNTYRYFDGYWLILAESYYLNGNFDKCLDAVTAYEESSVRIFRKDFDYARILPYAIASAAKVCTTKEYFDAADSFAQRILDNTSSDNWALRYYAAQTYADLYGRTKEEEYLQKSYDAALDNVNSLVATQRQLNADYLLPVVEKGTPKDATKEDKEQIKEYNKMLKEERKTELPPVYEPLVLNCELLFALADKLDISLSEKNKINSILHPNGEPLFLTKSLDEKFRFDGTGDTRPMDIVYNGNVIILPAELITNDPTIIVTVADEASDKPAIFSDWVVNEVGREDDSDITGFQAVCTSKTAGEYDWKAGLLISIDILPKGGMELPVYHYEFKSTGTKNHWYDYLKVWEGHKNNWYDYLKVWDNSVSFERA